MRLEPADNHFREVQLDTETPASRDALIAEANKPVDFRDRLERASVPDGPTTSGGSGPRNSPRRRRPKRRACRRPECGLDVVYCGHEQRGRQKLEIAKPVRLRVYLPDDLRAFLKRSTLHISDILEAVLSSPAMNCWRIHQRCYNNRLFQVVVDENGNEVETQVTALTIEMEKNSELRDDVERVTRIQNALTRLGRTDEIVAKAKNHFAGAALASRGFLSRLTPNIGERKEEWITQPLFDRFTTVKRKAARGPAHGVTRYSATRFCIYCIDYYMECVSIYRAERGMKSGPYRELVSSREEAKAIQPMAIRCWNCESAASATHHAIVQSSRGK